MDSQSFNPRPYGFKQIGLTEENFNLEVPMKSDRVSANHVAMKPKPNHQLEMKSKSKVTPMRNPEAYYTVEETQTSIVHRISLTLSNVEWPACYTSFN